MSKRKRKEASAAAGSPAWMTTFSDLMTLLLTFFILLFSMSSISEEKFRSLSQSLASSFSGGEGILEGVIIPPENGVEPVNPDALDPALLEMYNKVTQFIEKHDLGDSVAITADENGIYVNLNNAILFGKESASITREGKKVLRSIADLLNEIGNNVVIEGHTDNIPNAYGQYPTNWELSTTRAVSVLRYLSEEEKVNPMRLSAVGYGEYRPLVPNDTAENRAKNRRVNIVVVYEPEDE